MFIIKPHVHLGANQAQPHLATEGGEVEFICRLIRKGYKKHIKTRTEAVDSCFIEEVKHGQ